MQEVLFVSGQAASGKSQFSSVLAERHKAEKFDLDDTLSQTIEENKELLDRIGMEQFLSEVSSQRYENLLNRAIAAFFQGKSVLIEGPFSRHISDVALWERTVAPFLEKGVVPQLYWVHVPQNVRRARLSARSSERDREKLNNLDSYFAANPTIAPVVAHIPIDGTADFTSLDL